MLLGPVYLHLNFEKISFFCICSSKFQFFSNFQPNLTKVPILLGPVYLHLNFGK